MDGGGWARGLAAFGDGDRERGIAFESVDGGDGGAGVPADPVTEFNEVAGDKAFDKNGVCGFGAVDGQRVGELGDASVQKEPVRVHDGGAEEGVATEGAALDHSFAIYRLLSCLDYVSILGGGVWLAVAAGSYPEGPRTPRRDGERYRRAWVFVGVCVGARNLLCMGGWYWRRRGGGSMLWAGRWGAPLGGR